ncbi:MAG: flavodoxin family protein [Candidatus Eisenbacteria bacterium]
MTRAAPLVLALNGSPAAGGSVSRLLDALGEGVREGGAAFEHVRCFELHVRDCIACGPDATPGWCIFHDDMDRVYDAIVRAHAIVVGAPVWFDALPAPLKRVVDRCNCMTPLVTLPDGTQDLVPKLARTRRGVFVVAGSAEHPYDMAERSARGWMKWVGAKWEETIAWRHTDFGHGSVPDDLLARARATGLRLAQAPPLVPAS